MKSIHGRVVTLLLLLLIDLWATQNQYCSYSIKSSKSSAMLYEPVDISFSARQKTQNEVMFFDLKPIASDDYDIISIKEKRHEFNYHDAKKDFEFLLIPKKVGKIHVAFSFRIRRASDDAVAQAYTGSRDNVKSIPTINIDIAQPTLTLTITPATKSLDGVGEFSLKMKIDKESLSSYDKVNLLYTLEGRGYLKESFEPLKSIEGVSLFRGIKENPPRATESGYIYKKEWRYALVSPHSYTIPALSLKTYNFHTKEYKEYKIPEKKISVVPLDKATLLDDEEAPSSGIDFQKYLGWGYNLLLFIAGFIAAKLLELLPKREKKEAECCPKVRAASSPKELLREITPYLTSHNLEDEVQRLEALIYQEGSKEHFSQIKREIVQRVSDTHAGHNHQSSH